MPTSQRYWDIKIPKPTIPVQPFWMGYCIRSPTRGAGLFLLQRRHVFAEIQAGLDDIHGISICFGVQIVPRLSCFELFGSEFYSPGHAGDVICHACRFVNSFGLQICLTFSSLHYSFDSLHLDCSESEFVCSAVDDEQVIVLRRYCRRR